MFVRVRKNKSGSSSVFLIHSFRRPSSKSPSNKVIKYFGSCADPVLLNQLIEKAEALKQQLSDTPIPLNNYLDIKHNPNNSASFLGIQAFYSQIFKSLFRDLLSSAKDLQTLNDLVIMGIALSSTQIKYTVSSKNFFNIDLDSNKIYRLMDKLDDSVIEKIKTSVLKNNLTPISHISVMFYNISNVHFETDSKSDLFFSKEGKGERVQISLALIISDQGLAVGYEIFKGNIFENLIPTLNKLKEQYSVNNVTIFSNSNGINKTNIDALSTQNFKYIIASKISNLDSILTKEMLDQNGYSLSCDLKYKSIQLDENRKLITVFSSAKQDKDQKDRKSAMDKLENLIGQEYKIALRSFLKNSFIKLDKDSKIVWDQEKIKKSEQLDGYFCFITNTDQDYEEVIKNYNGFYEAEKKIRPIRHHEDRRIKAHFAICYLDFVILRYVEFILKKENIYISLETLNKYLKMIYEVRMEVDGVKESTATATPQEIAQIFKVLKLRSPQEYIEKSMRFKILK